MAPQPMQPMPAPWWQTLLVTIANLAIGVVLNHYLGTPAAVAGMAAGTVVAHALPSPADQAK